jgi:hypothetical protein
MPATPSPEDRLLAETVEAATETLTRANQLIAQLCDRLDQLADRINGIAAGPSLTLVEEKGDDDA